MLWRKHSWGEQAFGWGITLKNEQDFDFNRFHHEAPKNRFKPCYGVDGTGAKTLICTMVIMVMNSTFCYDR